MSQYNPLIHSNILSRIPCPQRRRRPGFMWWLFSPRFLLSALAPPSTCFAWKKSPKEGEEDTILKTLMKEVSIWKKQFLAKFAVINQIADVSEGHVTAGLLGLATKAAKVNNGVVPPFSGIATCHDLFNLLCYMIFIFVLILF